LGNDFPPGWDPHVDGCWFPDFDVQRYLLPYFDVGDQPIDEYGRTTFDRADIERLMRHLEWQRSRFEGQPEQWSVAEGAESGTVTLHLKREVVLAVLDKTLQMTRRALDCDGTLVFMGD
jgi:hypothetical protein